MHSKVTDSTHSSVAEGTTDSVTDTHTIDSVQSSVVEEAADPVADTESYALSS